MLPAVDRKCNTSCKEKTYRRIKEKKHKHKIKHKSHKTKSGFSSNKNLVQYSDVSSEELSSSEAGEIHSDFDEKEGTLRLKPHLNKLITNRLRITRVTSPRNLLEACSPLSNQWELESLPENSSMSTNLSLNNCIDMASEITHLKCKKNKKSNKKPRSPSSKKKKRKKDLKKKTSMLSNCDHSIVKFSNDLNLQVSKYNGDFNEPSNYNFIEPSHTPPLIESIHIKVSKNETAYKEDIKLTKHFRKEDKR